MQKIREEDWLQTKINGALADYVRASEFKPTEERALTAVTMVKHLWAICFWGSWIFFIGLGSIICQNNFRHSFSLTWSGKTCDIRRSL